MAGSDGTHTSERNVRIRPLAGEFADPELESDYWSDCAEVTAAGTRRVGTVVAVGFLAFTVDDLLNVGIGARWSLLLLVRILTVAPTLWLVEALRRRPEVVQDHRRLTLVQAALLGGYQVVALLQPGLGSVQTTSIGVVVITLFILVPNRLISTTVLSSVGVVAWLVTGAVRSEIPRAELASQGLILLAVLVVGFVGGNRLATTSRREFAMRLRERSINERLSVEVAWRQRMEHDLVRRANIDDLTGLANRRWFHELTEQELRRAQRHGHPLAVMALDVDHFKKINDTHGHTAGDDVLVDLGRVLNDQVRRVDIVGRVGGEEFAVILPGANLDRATYAAEGLRAAVAELRFNFDDTEVSPTISIGVTTCDIWTERVSEALDRADSALYQAKAGGRNRVEALECPTNASPPFVISPQVTEPAS
jgi:diguanylate cyclase (GGDEF)-like protein